MTIKHTEGPWYVVYEDDPDHLPTYFPQVLAENYCVVGSEGMYGYAPSTKQLNNNATLNKTKQNLPDLRFVIHWLKTGRSVEEAITELEICQQIIDAYKPAMVIPEGYVLISEAVLESWGKLQEVKAMTKIPCSGEELIKTLEGI